MEQVDSIVREQDADRVVSVHLGIGPLSGVDPHLLEQAFAISSAGSNAAGAELFIDCLPVVVNCRNCGTTSEVMPARLVCANCGNWQTKLVSGDELQLTRIEMDTGNKTHNTGKKPAAGANG